MSMPYHKELLRSSVSLRFREFFVFRNKAKGVMTLLCQFEKMIYPSGTGAADAASFMIALYRPCEKLKDSSGNTITQIKAVGYCLPTAGNMRYEMRGHWRKDPKYGIQYTRNRSFRPGKASLPISRQGRSKASVRKWRSASMMRLEIWHWRCWTRSRKSF